MACWLLAIAWSFRPGHPSALGFHHVLIRLRIVNISSWVSFPRKWGISRSFGGSPMLSLITLVPSRIISRSVHRGDATYGHLGRGKGPRANLSDTLCWSVAIPAPSSVTDSTAFHAVPVYLGAKVDVEGDCGYPQLLCHGVRQVGGSVGDDFDGHRDLLITPRIRCNYSGAGLQRPPPRLRPGNGSRPPPLPHQPPLPGYRHPSRG